MTDRFGAALALAAATHAGQRRPGTGIPYLAHLLVVTGLVLEHGGDEDEAIAALLHDAVDAGGGGALLDDLRARFGPRVAEVVAACSDSTDGGDARTWRERKAAYLEHLPALDDEGVLRVVLADKVHNARSIVREHRRLGAELWNRFEDRTGEDELWYLTGLVQALGGRGPDTLLADLRQARDELDLQLQAHAAAAPPAAAEVEIERKFLVRARPEPLPPGDRIEQGYLAVADDGTEVRIRRRAGASTMTVKSGPGHVRVEEELGIDDRRFEALWPLTAGRRVSKVRHRVPVGDVLAELDVYDGHLDGLAVVEVEFPSTAASAAFTPPEWFGPEVTGDGRYANQSLARSPGAPAPAGT
jgi:CYTH domain-containing protein